MVMNFWSRCLNVRASSRYLKRCLQHQVRGLNDGQIVHSTLPDVQIPNILIQEYLLSGLDKWHDKIAFECADTNRKLTYADIDKKSSAFAGFLQNVGLKKNDVIAIVLTNVPEYFAVLIGGMKAGVVISTINPAYTSSEIKKQLINCRAKLVVTLNGLYPTIREAVDGVQQEQQGRQPVPIVTINHTENESSPNGCIKFNEVTSKDWKELRATDASPTDVILLPYSSGTTGLPKGVQLTHRNLVANSVQCAAPELKLTTETHGSNQDVVPIMLPLFHLYGLGVIGINLFAQGVKFITLPKFTTDAFAKILHQQSPSILFVVPPMVLMLLNNPILKLEKLSSSVRTLVSAAAPLGAADINRFRDKTNAGIHLLQLYGMTETSPVTHSQSFVLENCIKIGGSGVLIPSTQCKICELGDTTFAPLGPNKSGELLIKGPQVMKGYLNNEQANRDTISDDGWLRTGDIAYYDEDGHFFITDRLKELIKVKGFQVAPAELEEVLRDHPDISDAAVIGVADKEQGEAPKAFVVLKKSSTIDADDIHKYMQEKVVNYKQLRGGIVLLETIPKTTSGKILRRNLKDL